MAAIKPAHVKVVCPTAPTMPVTLNSGFRMPSWFDLKTLDASGPEDDMGMFYLYWIYPFMIYIVKCGFEYNFS